MALVPNFTFNVKYRKNAFYDYTVTEVGITFALKDDIVVFEDSTAMEKTAQKGNPEAAITL